MEFFCVSCRTVGCLFMSWNFHNNYYSTFVLNKYQDVQGINGSDDQELRTFMK